MLMLMYRCPIPGLIGDACGDPPGIVHGKVQIKSNADNVTAYYTCDQGFVNVGTEELICLSSGKWKKAKINCGRVALPLSSCQNKGYQCIVLYCITASQSFRND